MKYIPLLLGLLLFGCMAPYKKVRTLEEPITNSAALSRFLDRSGSWESFTCRVKLKLEVGDTTVAARGTLIYMSPEKYSLSFARPYNQVIGDLYITAQQLMYWGNGKTKLFYSASDTIHIPELIPLAFPDWDPRDLLPFPVSGRTSGFQVTIEQQDSLDHQWIQGDCGQAKHTLSIDPGSGVINQEYVVRSSNERVSKTYSKYYLLQGWPVATRVTCEDETGRVKLIWTISHVELKSPDFSFDESETSHLIPQYHE